MKIPAKTARDTANKKTGAIAGFFLTVFGRPPKRTDQQAHKKDFKTSTRRMGIRFTDKLRDTFRKKWIKKH
ncbi:MAG: hypothetical protein KAS23_02865 [Anaerohalosphaera sp.]|nr:hypothetical protein [Anaerohalosphaera sp.]